MADGSDRSDHFELVDEYLLYVADGDALKESWIPMSTRVVSKNCGLFRAIRSNAKYRWSSDSSSSIANILSCYICHLCQPDALYVLVIDVELSLHERFVFSTNCVHIALGI